MSRNRIIYPNEVVYFAKYDTGEDAPSPGDPNPDPTTAKSLIRVQNANYSLDIPRTDVNQYGMLASIETLVTESPTVTTDITYLSSDGTNEKFFGMAVNPLADLPNEVPSIVGDLLEHDGTIYVVIGPEGHDILDGYTVSGFNAEDYEYFGIGNSSLSNYTVNGAVGDYLSTSVTFESLYIISDTLGPPTDALNNLGSVQSPTINTSTGIQIDNNPYELLFPNMRGDDSPCALRPGDITLTFPNEDLSFVRLQPDTNQAILKVQNFSLSLPLSRTPLDRLGTKYSYAREVDFPINATLTLSAIARNFNEKDLSELLESSGEFIIECSNENGSQLAYKIKGARLRSEAYSSGVGDNMTVDLSYEIPISAKNDTTRGIFLFGSTDATRRQQAPPSLPEPSPQLDPQ